MERSKRVKISIFIAFLFAFGSISTYFFLDYRSSSVRGLANDESLWQNTAFVLDRYAESIQARNAYASEEGKAISVMHFIVREDPAGLAYLSKLREAVRRGVNVRLIFDYWASLESSSERRLTRAMVKHLEEEGIEVRFFNKFEDKRSILKSPKRLLRRMHNKALYFHSSNTFFIGDRDIGGSYYGFKAKGEAFRSRDVVIKGLVAKDFLKHFNEMWNDLLVERLDENYSKLSQEEIARARERLDKIQRRMTKSKLFDRFKKIRDWSWKAKPVRKAIFHADRAGKGWSNTVHGRFLELLENAKKSVVFQTPYLILNPNSKGKLETAIDNGVKVQVFTNGTSITDEIYVPPAYDVDSKVLVGMGIDLYEADPEKTQKIYHSKTGVFDQKTTWHGTNNFDNRSEVWDRELAVEIEDESFAKQMQSYIDKDMAFMKKVPRGRSPLRYRSCRDYMMYLFSNLIRPIL